MNIKKVALREKKGAYQNILLYKLYLIQEI